jgi:hypothetical protein
MPEKAFSKITPLEDTFSRQNSRQTRVSQSFATTRHNRWTDPNSAKNQHDPKVDFLYFVAVPRRPQFLKGIATKDGLKFRIEVSSKPAFLKLLSNTVSSLPRFQHPNVRSGVREYTPLFRRVKPCYWNF